MTRPLLLSFVLLTGCAFAGDTASKEIFTLTGSTHALSLIQEPTNAVFETADSVFVNDTLVLIVKKGAVLKVHFGERK